jgi:hypothetical protein
MLPLHRTCVTNTAPAILKLLPNDIYRQDYGLNIWAGVTRMDSTTRRHRTESSFEIQHRRAPTREISSYAISDLSNIEIVKQTETITFFKITTKLSSPEWKHFEMKVTEEHCWAITQEA